MDRVATLLRDDIVLDTLRLLPDDIEAAAHHMIDAQVAWSAYRAMDLPCAKEELERVENEATMEAYASEEVDGSNQKKRDQQVAAFLGKHPGHMAALASCNAAEANLAQLDGERFAAEIMYKTTVYKLHAAQSVADIIASQLRVLANTKGERS